MLAKHTHTQSNVERRNEDRQNLRSSQSYHRTIGNAVSSWWCKIPWKEKLLMPYCWAVGTCAAVVCEN